VFAGEVVLVVVIVILARRMNDRPADPDAGLDLVGTALSALGLGLIVFGILRAGEWGFVLPKEPDEKSWLGLSPVVWLVLAGGLVLRVFLSWQRRRQESGRPALIDPALLRVPQLRSGLTSFCLQYLLQAGLFFVVPLFLSVALGLSAIDTGLRIMPLSLTLLLGAVGIPRFFPNASPRRVVRLGFLALLVGLATLIAALDVGVGPEVVTWPLLLAGLGIGALASQLGAITVSAVSDDHSAEVGGLQNTVTNLGASIGTALAGAVLISALSTSFFTGIEDNPDVPEQVSTQAQVELAGGVPFVSDDSLEQALDEAGVDPTTTSAIVEENSEARIDALRTSLSLLGLIALLAVFAAGSLPTRPPGGEPATTGDPPTSGPPVDGVT
jgi:hypothetical protein